MDNIEIKENIDVLVYILKWMFLPLEDVFLPDGSKICVVSSISFINMDQLVFNDFYESAIIYLSGRLDITRDELEKEIL